MIHPCHILIAHLIKRPHIVRQVALFYGVNGCPKLGQCALQCGKHHIKFGKIGGKAQPYYISDKFLRLVVGQTVFPIVLQYNNVIFHTI